VFPEVWHSGLKGAQVALLPEDVAPLVEGGPYIGFLERKRAAGEVSDAMLVWIALPADSFWVRFWRRVRGQASRLLISSRR
jgi:hypothetical protein